MALIYCPSGKVNGKKNCKAVPVKLLEFKIERDSIFEKLGIKQGFAKDLQIVSAIDKLAKKLSPELKQIAQNTIRRAVESDKRLPADASIQFK